ncbi:MAG: hypothetical protein JO033_03410 [Acidobacteriaceae bacterium]|nr:hypothetical protein [Acidobacteriaceae bacterium]
MQGDYALVGTYGANVARLLGTYHADGLGNLKGTAKVNLPGAGTERVVVSLRMEGTYTISEDGTGIVYVTVIFPDGRTSDVTLDLLIKKAEVIDGLKNRDRNHDRAARAQSRRRRGVCHSRGDQATRHRTRLSPFEVHTKNCCEDWLGKGEPSRLLIRSLKRFYKFRRWRLCLQLFHGCAGLAGLG